MTGGDNETAVAGSDVFGLPMYREDAAGGGKIIVAIRRPKAMNRRQRKKKRQREQNRNKKDQLENFAAEPGQTSDTRIMERAIRERWPITPELRERMAKRMAAIVLSKKSSTRERTSAYRAVVGSDRLNQLEEQHTVDRKEAKERDGRDGAATAITVNFATAVQVNSAQAITEATDEQLQKFLDATSDFVDPVDPGTGAAGPLHAPAIVDQAAGNGGIGETEAATIAKPTPSTNGFHPPFAKPSTNGVSGKHHA